MSVNPSGGGKRWEGCGNDGLEEARGKPLAELTGADLRIVVFHRLPQRLETSANNAELSTFPQPRRTMGLGDKARACGAVCKPSRCTVRHGKERDADIGK